MATRTADLTIDLDALFQLPLAEFTAARNALAGRLKKDGLADEADQVKALAKPPVSAWTVNQLFWRHRREMDALLEAGERFRKAQAAQLAGKASDLRQLLEARRETLATLSREAGNILRTSGHAATPDTMRRITTTLEALASYGATPDAPQAGRLTDDVDPPGFEALAALVPRSGGNKPAATEPRVLPFRPDRMTAKGGKRKSGAEENEQARKARIAAAKQALRDAEAALKEARRDAGRAEGALKDAAARAKSAEKVKADAEARFEKAAAEAESASKEARRVAREAEDAAQAVTDAERQLEKAKEALANTEG